MATRRLPLKPQRSALQFSLNRIQLFFLAGGALLVCTLCFSLGLMLGYQLSGVSLRKQLPSREEISSLVKKSRDSSFYETLPDLPKEPAKEKSAVVKPKLKTKTKTTKIAKPKPKVETIRGYFVQVAAFKSRVSARKLRDELKKKGYPAAVSQSDLGEKGEWFRVRLGKYATYQQAKTASEQVRRQTKLKPFIAQ